MFDKIVGALTATAGMLYRTIEVKRYYNVPKAPQYDNTATVTITCKHGYVSRCKVHWQNNDDFTVMVCPNCNSGLTLRTANLRNLDKQSPAGSGHIYRVVG